MALQVQFLLDFVYSILQVFYLQQEKKSNLASIKLSVIYQLY